MDSPRKKVGKQLDVFLDKNVIRVIWVIAIFSIIGFFKGCPYSRNIETTKGNQEILIEDFDSLLNVIPDVDKLFKIQLLEFKKTSLESARNMLYDESAIDQRKLSTDEVLDKYNNKIEDVDKQIKEIGRASCRERV